MTQEGKQCSVKVGGGGGGFSTRQCSAGPASSLAPTMKIQTNDTRRFSSEGGGGADQKGSVRQQGQVSGVIQGVQGLPLGQ